ncbi:hypothetical protein U0070_017797, partial [Myodes glareolus]
SSLEACSLLVFYTSEGEASWGCPCSYAYPAEEASIILLPEDEPGFLARKMLWKWEGIESEGEEARGRREGGRGEEKEGQEGSREERESGGEEEGGERWEKEETGVGEVLLTDHQRHGHESYASPSSRQGNLSAGQDWFKGPVDA